MSRFEKVLNYFGLVSKKKYDQNQESWVRFVKILGNAAKEKGVKVVLEREIVKDVYIDSDIFIIGSNNYISNITTSGMLSLAPSCQHNLISGVRLEEKRTGPIYGNKVKTN